MKAPIADVLLYVEVDGDLVEVNLDWDQQMFLLEYLNENFSVDVERTREQRRRLTLLKGGKDGRDGGPLPYSSDTGECS